MSHTNKYVKALAFFKAKCNESIFGEELSSGEIYERREVKVVRAQESNLGLAVAREALSSLLLPPSSPTTSSAGVTFMSPLRKKRGLRRA